MIDDIVEMILHVAHQRPGEDREEVIYQVMRELEGAMTKVIETARDIERSKEENENKG